MMVFSQESEAHLGLLSKLMGLVSRVLGQSQGSCVQFWVPQYVGGMDIPERDQRSITRVIKFLDHLYHEKRLGKLGLLTLKKRRLKGILLLYIST